MSKRIDTLFGHTLPTDILSKADGDLLYASLGSIGSGGGTGTASIAPTRASLASMASSLAIVELSESGREGFFVWKTGNFSAQVTTDTQQGAYIAPASAPTGVSGAWVRLGTIRPTHFGAFGNGTTDDIVALQCFWNVVIAYEVLHDCSGNFAISTTLNIGPAVAPTTQPAIPFVGRMHLTALTAMLEMVHIKNVRYRHWLGALFLTGTGGTSYVSRTCLIGVHFENCGRTQISGGIHAQRFALAGVWVGIPNNNMLGLGFVVATDISSGHSNGLGLTGNWSSASNSGSSGSTAQRTTVTVDTIYDASLDTYLDVAGNNDPVHLRINGYLYSVTAFNRVAGTATIYPWIDPAAGSSGTYEWVFGGGLYTRGSDSNLVTARGLDVDNCGRGLTVASLYGPIIENIQANVCGTVVCLGRNNAAACLGTLVKGYYVEGSSANQEHIVVNATIGNSFWAQFISDSGGFDLGKCWALGDPRATGGQIVGGEFGVRGSGTNGAVSVTKRGKLLAPLKNNLSRGPGSTMNLTAQSRDPHPEIYARDSHTLNLLVIGSGENNRLLGYTGGVVGYIGTGTNGAPTGTFTFNPPTIVTTANTTNASAVVTMASTAGLAVSMPVTGTGIPGATTISSVDSATQITLSASATATGTPTLTFTGSINGTYAAVAFSGFIRPVWFSYEHTDNTQMIWKVYPITGVMPPVFTSSANGVVPASGGGTTNYLRADGTWAAPPGGGTGTVTTVSVTTANGVSGSVATPTTTPAITLALGAITPSSVAATGTVTGTNLSGTNTGDQTITLTGNVTGSGTGSFATTIANNAVTLAKLATQADQTILGNVSGSTAVPTALTATQATAVLNAFTSTLKGLTPASGGGTTNFLRADGTWTVPPGGAGLAWAPVQATGTGSSQNITIPESGLSAADILVFVNGVLQIATTHYTLSGTTVTLTSNAAGDAIQILKPAGGTITGGGTTTNAATFNNGGSGAASGTTFDGSAARTISYNTLGAAPTVAPTFTSTSGAPLTLTDGAAHTATIYTNSNGLTLTNATDIFLTCDGTHGIHAGTIGAAINGKLGWGNYTNSSPNAGDIWFDGTTFQVRGTLNASGAITGSNLSGTNTGDQTITLTGDVTGSGTGSFAATIAANSVTLAKMATQANNTILGNVSGSTAVPVALTATQTTAMLNAFTSSLQGVVPSSGGGTTNFLRADGSWAAPSGGGGTTTNALTFSNAGSGDASGSTFNGSAAKTISYNSIGAAGAAIVDVFTSSGTWTKRAGVTSVTVIVIGAGGGGGGGRSGAAGSTRVGGGGGGGGGVTWENFGASILGSTETVTIGAGGSGGTAQTTVSTNGNNATAGGYSAFGSWATALGGGLGFGGTSSTGSAGSGGMAVWQGGAGTGGQTTTAGNTSGNSGHATIGGAGGGGVNTSNTAGVGGNSYVLPSRGTTGFGVNAPLDATGGANTGGNGGNGGNFTQSYGGGGAGGGGNASGAGGTGGNGGTYGGGGAGGGAGTDSLGGGGAGGNGAGGVVVVYNYF